MSISRGGATRGLTGVQCGKRKGRALLCDLQEAAHTNTQGKLTIAWCPDYVLVCRTRSAHAGAPSGMLFNELKGQEFIFCMVRVYAQSRRGLGPGAGPGPGQGICCSPHTSLPTVPTAPPCVSLLLVAFEHDPARRHEATDTVVHFHQRRPRPGQRARPSAQRDTAKQVPRHHGS